MPDNLIDELRAKIDVKHAEALQALALISSYLESDQTPGGAISRPANRALGSNISRADNFATNGHAGKSNRELVHQSLKDRTNGLSVDDIATATGLTVKQIRGVLHSPNLHGTFGVRKSPDGKKATYFLNSQDE